MNETQNFIADNFFSITQGEDAEGKCDDWNGQLADKLSSLGWQASLIAEPHIQLLNKNGKPLGHHAITIGHSPSDNIWIAADLSASQIQGKNNIFFVQADSLNEIAQAIRNFYGGNWKALNNELAIINESKRRLNVLNERRRLRG